MKSLLTNNSRNTKSASTIMFTQEACDTTQVESVNKAKLQFVEHENKTLKMQVTDL